MVAASLVRNLAAEVATDKPRGRSPSATHRLPSGLCEPAAPFVTGDTAEFADEMAEHAARLRKAPFGEALLWTIGYVYEHKGLQVTGRPRPSPGG